MSLESGSITLRRYYMQSPCKASSDPSWVQSLRENAFIERQLGMDEENMGWAVFANELSTDFAIESTAYGKYILLSFRRETVKVQRTLLNLHVKARVKERLKELESETLSQKQKTEIKEEVSAELLENAQANLQVIQVLVDTARKEVYLSTTSDKSCESFEVLFLKTFNIKLLEANFMATSQKIVEDQIFEDILDGPGIRLGPEFDIHPDFEDTSEGKLGSAFLTWLLYILQTGDGTWKSKSLGEFGMILNEYLLLEGEALGSKQMLLKKGVLGRCAELATSLKVGKLVSKIRVQVARGDDGSTPAPEGGEDREPASEAEEWAFVVDKLNFDLASLKVPKYNDGSEAARVIGRMGYIVEAFEIMDELFETFLDIRYGKSWNSVHKKMTNWVVELQSGDWGQDT
ncbi:MAG: recombination-associated protein RdgC [Planctomycetes bacterium]|nr:recombination-associated protein RdgC [Planctomycetota bacterium]